MQNIKVNNKQCFIIAEAGVNHNGDLNLAKKLVDAAKSAGADSVKFQTFKTKELVATRGSHFAILKKLELSERDFLELKKYCDKKGIIFLSTPHTESAVDFLDKLVPAFKIASGDLTNLPFLEKIAKKKKPIILSTGMANLDEIEEAIKTIRKISKKKISLLHCTTSYPCPPEDVNLRAILLLKNKFEKRFAPLDVGYSDHTEGIIVSIGALAMGARVLEKHFTLDKKMAGPDHKASLGPKELKEMVKAVRSIETALGNGLKKPTKNEDKIKKIARKSIVANINIKSGETIKSGMLSIKRPGTGIAPVYIGKIIGKKAKKDIKEDTLIKFKDLR